MVRPRVWPLLIPAGLAGFALYDLQAGVAISSIAWFVLADAVQVLIVALGLKYSFDGVPQLNSKEALAKYSFFAVFLAPLIAAFISAQGIGHAYWSSWRICFFSDVLAFVTVMPAMLSWVGIAAAARRKSRSYYLEAAAQLTCGSFRLRDPSVFRREQFAGPALFSSSNFALVGVANWVGRD